MSQAGKDSRSEGDCVEPTMGDNCDNFALFAPLDELPTIGGGVGAREQPS